jgi:hypothetical protein
MVTFWREITERDLRCKLHLLKIMNPFNEKINMEIDSDESQ